MENIDKAKVETWVSKYITVDNNTVEVFKDDNILINGEPLRDIDDVKIVLNVIIRAMLSIVNR